MPSVDEEMRMLELGLGDAHRRFRLLAVLWQACPEAMVPETFIGRLGRALDDVFAAIRIPEEAIVRRQDSRTRRPFPEPWSTPTPKPSKKPRNPHTLVALVKEAIRIATVEGRWISTTDILATVMVARPAARRNHVSATLSSLAALGEVERERHPDGFRYQTAGSLVKTASVVEEPHV